MELAGGIDADPPQVPRERLRRDLGSYPEWKKSRKSGSYVVVQLRLPESRPGDMLMDGTSARTTATRQTR